MALTLGNDLTGLVSREVDAAESKASGLGSSLTTGNDVFVEVVDGFLGNSLRDEEIVLGAVAKNTAYSINLLTITDEYLNTIASALQEGFKTIGNAGPLSANKLAVLQKILNDKRAQVNLLIKTAEFDNKKLLSGVELGIQAGLHVNDTIPIKVNDISTGKLFRSSITTDLNKAIIANPALGNNYYANADEVNAAANKNINLIYSAIRRPAQAIGGGSIVGVLMTNVTVGNLLFGLTDNQKELLDLMAPLASAQLAASGGFIGSNNVHIAAVYNPDPVANPNFNANVAELLTILQDDAATNISVEGNFANRVFALNVFLNALDLVRTEQAAISNQKSNVVEAADALRATTNVTQKAADSYLKTDYVLTAQQYAETIRTLVASITSLQAANKIPEAAQRLINALAR